LALPLRQWAGEAALSISRIMSAMKTSIHFRFGLYVLLMTACFAGTVIWLYLHISRFPPIFYLLFPPARRILGPSYKDWHESDREISDRTLVWGFLGFLVVFWVGVLYVAFHLNPVHQAAKYIIWTAAGVLWLVCIYPGYRWWRVQKKEADA
jgi:hypothetical protein